MEIVLVEDHQDTREELCSLIEEEEDLSVVGQAGNGKQGVDMVQALHPDVVVMDVVMPEMNGLEATRAITSSSVKSRVLALTNYTGRHLLESLKEAGASGYVRKDRAYERLVAAIRSIADGKPYFPNEDTANSRSR